MNRNRETEIVSSRGGNATVYQYNQYNLHIISNAQLLFTLVVISTCLIVCAKISADLSKA